MKVLVNGDERELAEGATVGSVLDELDVAPERRGIAVAVDAEVVARGDWDSRALSEGERLEVVAAIQGG